MNDNKVNLNSIMDFEETNGTLSSNSLVSEYLEKVKKIEMKR